MEDEEGGEEEVEDIVGGEHGQDLSRLYAAHHINVLFVRFLCFARKSYSCVLKRWMSVKTSAGKTLIDGNSSAAAAVVNWLYLDVYFHVLFVCKD